MFIPPPRLVPLRRRAGALATSLLLAGGLLTGLALVGASHTDLDPPLDKEPPLVEIIGREPAPAPPGPPSAPRAREARVAAPRDAIAAPLPSPEAEPVETPPVETAPVEPAAGAPLGGDPQPGGQGLGTGGGGGPEGGTGTGGQGAGPPQVDKVRVVHRVMPRFPDAARSLGEEARCRVEFTIDERGVPTAVSVSDCPAVFRPAVEEATWKWRFQPARINGRKSAARFVLTVRFELR